MYDAQNSTAAMLLIPTRGARSSYTESSRLHYYLRANTSFKLRENECEEFLIMSASKKKKGTPTLSKSGTFVVGGPGAKRRKKRNFQGLCRHFRYGLLNVFEFCFIFCPMLDAVPSAATRPRALQLESRRENRFIRMTSSRAIEGIESVIVVG